jgi:hypothetical protein
MKKINFVKTVGALIVGMVEQEEAVVAESKCTTCSRDDGAMVAMIGNPGIVMLKPRIVSMNRETQMIELSAMIASPAKVILSGPIDFQYESNDPTFDAFYKENTIEIPGLQLVKS